MILLIFKCIQNRIYCALFGDCRERAHFEFGQHAAHLHYVATLMDLKNKLYLDYNLKNYCAIFLDILLCTCVIFKE